MIKLALFVVLMASAVMARSAINLQLVRRTSSALGDNNNGHGSYTDVLNTNSIATSSSLSVVSSLRAGAGGSKPQPFIGRAKKPPKKADKMKELYGQVLPLVRAHITGVVICTIIHMTGLIETADWFSLDWQKAIFRLQLWRPITAACFLGPPSMGLASSIYWLVRYGQPLEMILGGANHAIFMVVQALLILPFLCALVGMPFTASALITAILHNYARHHAGEQIPFQFGIMLDAWMLPFAHMVIDILQAQSLSSATPHIVGIIGGHFYYFHTQIWPKMGGKDWLSAPLWLQKKLGGVGGRENVLRMRMMENELRQKKAKQGGGGDDEDEGEDEAWSSGSGGAGNKKKGKGKKMQRPPGRKLSD